MVWQALGWNPISEAHSWSSHTTWEWEDMSSSLASSKRRNRCCSQPSRICQRGRSRASSRAPFLPPRPVRWILPWQCQKLLSGLGGGSGCLSPPEPEAQLAPAESSLCHQHTWSLGRVMGLSPDCSKFFLSCKVKLGIILIKWLMLWWLLKPWLKLRVA